MKKLLTISLVFIMLFTFLAACKEKPVDESSNPGAAESNNASDDVSKTDDNYEFDLTKRYDGTTIKILCINKERHTYGELQFVPDPEITSNVINDTVAQRNNLILENNGITIQTVPVKFPSEEIARLISSNDDEYQIVSDCIMLLMPGMLNGYYQPLDDVIEIDAPWWDKNALSELTFNDNHYFFSGDAIITDDDHIYLTLFNKTMYNEQFSDKYGDIYKTARDGEWTIDLMTTMAKEVARPDINGAWGADATYGLVGSINAGNVFMHASGLGVVRRDGENVIITADSEANINAFDKVFALTADKHVTMMAEYLTSEGDSGGFGGMTKIFDTGRSLFISTTATSITRMKNSEEEIVNFGVLPNAKLTADQENYHHTVNTGNSTVLCVPNTNTEKFYETVYLLDLLGYYGRNQSGLSLTDAYYEKMLKLQGVEKSEDAEMLDVIFSNRFYDIAGIMPWGKSPTLGQLYGWLISTQSRELASKMESMKSQIEADIEKTLTDLANR